MLGQLTAREDGGIDHGESRQLRAGGPADLLPLASAGKSIQQEALE
jgi:hypothetical protein